MRSVGSKSIKTNEIRSKEETPPHADGDLPATGTQRRSGGFVIAWVIVAVLSLGVGVPFAYVEKAASVAVVGAVSISFLISWLLVRRGHVRLSYWFLLSACWANVTFVVVLAGGVDGSIIPIYYVVISVGSGRLLGRRGVLLFSTLSVLASGVMAIVEAAVGKFPVVFPEPLAASWLHLLTAMMLVSVPYMRVLLSLRNAEGFREKREEDIRRVKGVIRELETRNQALFDSARDAIFLADADTGMIVDANPAAEALSGRTLAELRSLHHTGLYPAEYAELADADFKKSARDSGLTRGRLLHKDGHLVPIEISSSHLPTVAGGRLIFGIFRDITERAAVEHALRQSEARFQQVAESAGEFIWEVDADGLYTYASPGLQQILGYTPEEVVGEFHFYDFFVPETREETRQAAFAVFARKGFFRSFANANVRKDGVRVDLESSGMPVLDADGNLVGYRGTDTDVTERRRAEVALRESEERFRNLADTAPVMIWVSGTDRLCTFFNKPWLDFTGRRMEQELGNGWSDGVHPEDLDRCRTVYESSFAARRAFEMEYRLRRADGEYRWILDHGVPYASEGEFGGFIGSCIDVTDRRRAEAELARSHSLLAAALESTTDGILVVDSAGKVTAFNRKFQNMWRIPEALMAAGDEEQLFRHIADQFADPTGFSNGVRALYQTPYANTADELASKDGRVFERHSQPQRLGDNIVGRVWNFRDITERKRSENKTLQLRAELAHVHRISTMGQLASAIAHELSQPLGAILSNAAAAQFLIPSSGSEQANREFGEILEDILADTTRAGHIIRKLRDMVARHEDTSFVELDVNVLIRDVLRLCQGSLTLEKIALVLDLQDNLPPVRGDRIQLQQVLMNLITNAVESMKASFSRELTIRSTMQALGTITISISDSGPGINEAAKNKIFVPFYSTKKGGLGMGLRICQSIIEAHDGQIWAENNVFAGATFSFSLRTCDGDPDATDSRRDNREAREY